MEIIEGIKSVLEYFWMVFFSIIYFVGYCIIICLVLTWSYNRKAPAKGDNLKFWRFVKVYVLFPLYYILLLGNAIRNFRKFENVMGLFLLLLFQHVDELIFLYGGTMKLTAILMFSAFVISSLISLIVLRSDAIKAKEELLAEQGVKQEVEENPEDESETPQEEQNNQDEPIVEK